MGFWGPSAGQQSPAGLGRHTAPQPAPPDHSGQGPDYSARPPRCWPGLFAWPAQTQESRFRPLNALSVSEVQSSPSPLASSPSSGAAAAADGYREALSEEADRDPGAGATGPQLGHAGGCGLPAVPALAPPLHPGSQTGSPAPNPQLRELSQTDREGGGGGDAEPACKPRAEGSP